VATKFFKFTFYFLLAFTFSITPTFAKQPQISSQGAILIEPKTNTILYEKNAYDKFYPASITKIMTALIIAEEMPTSTIITKSSDSIAKVPSDSSSIGLLVGDQYTMSNGLCGLLLGSDNFIAHDLALTHSGSISAFASEMNTRAKSYGALSTHFSNPHGYHDSNHYTTPYDMAQIAKVAFANPTVSKIAGTASSTFSYQNRKQTLVLTNTSRLLKDQTPYYNTHVVACKTGFHDAAQQTLVAKAVYGDLELIAVIMRASTPNQYIDINNLFEYGSQNFDIEKTKTGYTLINHTMSNWAKPAITTALESGWISDNGIDYQSNIQLQDLIWLLKQIKPLKDLHTTDLTLPLKASLTDIVTRQSMAQVMNLINQKLSLIDFNYKTLLPISDLNTLSFSEQQAISFVTSTQLMSLDESGAFNPYDFVTWQEAINILYQYFICI